MQIPLNFWVVSLWLAVTSVILLATAHLVSAYDGPASLLVDKRKLKNVALVVGILFLVTIAIRMYGTATSF